MSRENRAKQFVPFDAVKGLQEALKIKEYEHDRIEKGNITEDKAREISKVLLNIEKDCKYTVKYFLDGYYNTLTGILKLKIEENILLIDNKKILLDNICDIKKVGE